MKSLLEAASLRDTLARHHRDDRPARVRVTKRPMNGGVASAEIDACDLRGPANRRAVGKLIEAGELVEVYRQGLVTDYALADHEPEEDPDMSTEPRPVRLTRGDTLSTNELADILDIRRQSVTNIISRGELNAEKEDPEKPRSPYRIAVDDALGAALDKRGVEYELEGDDPDPDEEAVAISDNAEGGQSEGSGQKVDQPEAASERSEAAPVDKPTEPAAEMATAEPSGDGQASDTPAPPSTAKAEHYRDLPPHTSSHPVRALIDEAARYDATPLYQQAGDALRSAHHQAQRLAALSEALTALTMSLSYDEDDPLPMLAKMLREETGQLVDDLRMSDRDLTLKAHREVARRQKREDEYVGVA